jgi:hypothetical protein
MPLLDGFAKAGGPASSGATMRMKPTKFLFGTDWWVVDPERAMDDIHGLNFRSEPLQKILRDNALRVFNIKSPRESRSVRRRHVTS